jgi:hypothetical protein
MVHCHKIELAEWYKNASWEMYKESGDVYYLGCVLKALSFIVSELGLKFIGAVADK